MADAIVGAVLEKLYSLIILMEGGLILGIKDDLTKLVDTLTAIRAVLADAERQQIENKPIRNWLLKLKHAAYVAEDVLDDMLTKAQVSTPALPFLNFVSRRKMAKKTMNMLSTFEEIANQRSQFMLNALPFPEMHSQFEQNRETTPSVEPYVYGRDDERENIVRMLLNNQFNQNTVTVCPIVGMAGLGKTTLAQLVYNDERVASFFDCRIWMYVYEPFDVKRILMSIIGVLSGSMGSRDLTLEQIHSMFNEMLKDKRYLLVLDDMWKVNQDEWNMLQSFLKVGAQGSSIILTTRLSTLALFTGTVEPFYLSTISEDDCWSLLKHCAFIHSNEEERHLNLVPIGKDIAKNCKGLPLTARAMGHLLRGKTDEREWERVKYSLEEGIGDSGKTHEREWDSVLPTLRLSYDHLPTVLKQCFAFCSRFPRDHDMEKDVLIRLWIASGFIQTQGSMELEEVGEYIFHELLQRSFFQHGQQDGFGNIITCQMHNLMHDLAVSVSTDEFLAVKVGDNPEHVPKTIRHLRVISDSPQSSNHAHHFLRPWSSFCPILSFDSVTFDKFNFPSSLRVLDLCGMEIKTLPSSIYRLKHLRYLDLSCNDIRLLPNSICKLVNLQTLDLSSNLNLKIVPSSIGKLKQLRYLNLSYTSIAILPETVCEQVNLRSLLLRNCYELRVLPEDMRKLSILKHLGTEGCPMLTKMPFGIGELTCLQTLSLFKVGEPADRDGGCAAGIKELEGLNQLRGVLHIEGLEHVNNAEDIEAANLSSKQYLTELHLRWG